MTKGRRGHSRQRRSSNRLRKDRAGLRLLAFLFVARTQVVIASRRTNRATMVPFQRAYHSGEWTVLKRKRSYLSRIFEPYLYTPEGFRLTKQRYVVQQDTVNLPAAERRAVTICNLFSNEHKDIDEIAKLLETSRRSVITDLIHAGLIQDRRGANLNHKLERNRLQSTTCPWYRSDGPTPSPVWAIRLENGE